MKTDKKNELIFMDNSFANIAGMWVYPLHYNPKEDKFYDGFTAHQDNMNEIKFTKKQHKYLIKCFEDYHKNREKIWTEYKKFLKNYPDGIYTIPINDGIEWLNKIMGYDYVNTVPNNLKL